MLAGVRFGVQAVASTSAIGLRNDEIEMEILRASSASEFSHKVRRETGKE